MTTAPAEQLLRRIEAVRASVVVHGEVGAARDVGHPVHPAHRTSAANLDHFVALRSSDLRSLQHDLAALGLSSLGRSEAHVLATLDAVDRALRAIAGMMPNEFEPTLAPTFEDGPELLRRKTDDLLGEPSGQRETRIMVTLPSDAGVRPDLIESFVRLGMDVARINCAHDDAATWKAMANHVRVAAAAHGRDVKILMDLAGPKLRTGPIRLGPVVLRLKPRRDVYGRVLQPSRAVLVASDNEPPDNSVQQVPRIPVELAFLGALEVGDELRFSDARDAQRMLTVVATDQLGAHVRGTKTIYLTPGIVLEAGPGRMAGTVGALEPTEGALPLSVGDLVELVPGVGADAVAVLGESWAAGGCRLGCTLAAAVTALACGDRVFFDDGKFGGVVESTDDRKAWVRITSAPPGGGKLKAEKGINVPDTCVPVAALTEQDVEDLATVVGLADMVALSFVRDPADVELLQDRLTELGATDIGLVLKIETVQAFNRLPGLLRQAMRTERVGVMIARGDLAVEAGYVRLAELQEEILWLCEAAHLPVIWATEVLDQLARTGRPSRSEITDAAMSERAECVMLNKGPHIVDAIVTLDDILRRMAEHQSKKRPLLRPLRSWALPTG